jgi:uridylate kinase
LGSDKDKRVLLKISGEALMDSPHFGVSQEAVLSLAKKISALRHYGCTIGIVLGGGNIFRGIQQGPSLGLERTPADLAGMVATLINGIVLAESLKSFGLDVRLMTALDCPKVAESYHWEKAMNYLKEEKIVLFLGGTGHPYFTTDTCAALRGVEMHADVLIKSTMHVDGIYSKDPRKYPDAIKYEHLTYEQALDERLGVMDITAITLCRESGLPIRVFNLNKGSFVEALQGKLGSLISSK